MSVVWLLLEIVMLFFYFDLPKVTATTEDDNQGVSDYSVDSETNFVGRGPTLPNRSINPVMQRSTDIITSGDLSGSSTTVDGEKQKLLSVTATGYRKRRRTTSVMENWHLAKGVFTLMLNNIFFVCGICKFRQPSSQNILSKKKNKTTKKIENWMSLLSKKI